MSRYALIIWRDILDVEYRRREEFQAPSITTAMIAAAAMLVRWQEEDNPPRRMWRSVSLWQLLPDDAIRVAGGTPLERLRRRGLFQ